MNPCARELKHSGTHTDCSHPPCARPPPTDLTCPPTSSIIPVTLQRFQGAPLSQTPETCRRIQNTIPACHMSRVLLLQPLHVTCLPQPSITQAPHLSCHLRRYITQAPFLHSSPARQPPSCPLSLSRWRSQSHRRLSAYAATPHSGLLCK